MAVLIAWLRDSPLPRLLYRLYGGYLRLRRPRTLGVRTLVLDRDGAILLIRHSYRPGWFLPGGGVAKWETLEAAARRETREEGGVEIDGAVELFGMYANFTAHCCDHVALYVARRWRPVVSHSVEVVETRFAAPHDLPTDTTPATRRRIEEFLGRADRVAHW